MWLLWTALIIIGLIVVAVLVSKPFSSFGHSVRLERAREMFTLQRPLLEDQFLQGAAATGKPRGLIWKECQWEPNPLFARERQTRQFVALLGVTIRFEAIPGSDMEGLPAVGNLRNASAVFFFDKGQWKTIGKAVFNLNPDETVKHFASQYECV